MKGAELLICLLAEVLQQSYFIFPVECKHPHFRNNADSKCTSYLAAWNVPPGEERHAAMQASQLSLPLAPSGRRGGSWFPFPVKKGLTWACRAVPCS